MEEAIAAASYKIGIPGLSLAAKGLPAVILYFGTGVAGIAAIAGAVYHIVNYFQEPTKRND